MDQGSTEKEKQMLRACTMTAALLGAATAATAQLNLIGPFTGDEQEGFEQYPTGQFVSQLANAFNGTAVFNQIGGNQGLGVTGGWGYLCGVSAFAGSKMMGGTSNVIVEWVFDTPATRVGGYFTTNADVSHALFRFYDDSNNLIATERANTPLCSWAWNGWETTGAGIKRIEVEGVHTIGGHIMHDDLEVTYGETSCYADCDPSTGPGVLDLFDFLCFQDSFVAGEPYACDCDTTTGPLVCDLFDFLCFQDAFVSGCP